MPDPRDRNPEVKSALTEFYKSLDRDEITRQGAAHLRGRADVRAQRMLHWARLVVLVLIIASVVVGMAFCAWLLHTAQSSGQRFSDLRNQVIQAYTDDENP